MCLSGIPLPAGEKRLSAAAKRPSNTEKTLYISGLSTIWPSPPAAEFMRLAADWQRIGSGIRQQRRHCRLRRIRRRVECLDRRQRPLETLDLDQTELPGAALREAGGAGIARQNVRVAMHAERLLGGGVVGVVPGAGRQLHDTGPQRLAQHRAGKARPAVVEEANDVALADAARRGILGMNADRLSPVDLRG